MSEHKEKMINERAVYRIFSLFSIEAVLLGFWGSALGVQKVAFDITHNVDVYYGVGQPGKQYYLHTYVGVIKAIWNRC